MDPHRGLHLRRHFNNNKRQGLGPLNGLVPIVQSSAATPTTTSSAASQSAANTGNGGGILGGITSLFDGLTTIFMPTSGPSSATTPITPLTLSSSSSTGSTTTPTPSTHSTPSSTPSMTPTPTTTSTPISTSTPSSSVTDTVYTSSAGTSVVYITSELSPPSPTTTPRSFLQDPSLEGGVFALVGIVVLVVLFIVVTWTIRNRRRARLERDLAAAVTFDPGATDYYERQQDSAEKRRLSVSSSGHGHGRTLVQPAYVHQQDYHIPNHSMGYTQYPVAAYRAPSPTYPQPVAQGGANLTRKFSDRKPVPPLLPDPPYDPSNTHVSIPPHFYHQ